MPTKTPHNWRKLQRHPLGAEYEDLPPAQFEEMVKGVKEHGIINNRKVTLHEGKVIDGWQMYRACLAAKVKPDFTYIPRHLTPEQFVEIVNDLRRHESAEMALRRIKKRREQVLRLRAEGKTTREIAEEVGASQPTVTRDLAEADSRESVEPETVQGKDGRQHKSRKAEREPGDDAASEAADGQRPRAGRVSYDRKAWNAAYGALMRQIDVLGKAYKAKDTPGAEGLRRLLGEWREAFWKWHDELVKADREANKRK